MTPDSRWSSQQQGLTPKRWQRSFPWVTQVSTEEREECAQQIYSAAQSAAASGSMTQLRHVLGRWHGH